MRQEKQEKQQAASDDIAAPAVGYVLRQIERQRYQDCASFAQRVLAAHGLSIDAGMIGVLYASWRHEQETQGKEAHAPATE